ncbi:MAG: hypothetical protein CVV64_06855 [Candidatus Wallbacteria bacterium HGW-Wallbacteria-1]|jgi:methyl-accepting chemotaxis protein|uniref:HAMP domain-containing protein n=1 Tax=Candidatus Wallbacteria bacterium HGW-Wallbacteria-1 TaxID=2013854 RepID=A0A2N1PSZ6_9BACT|nr:MAG: hypothetical protein CVV64_06855 [Candidatus Wallbacteria bacterium HGW-Wallbacteria-1]
MSGQYHRKTFLIKKGLQYRYMGIVILAMLAVSAVVGFTIYFTIWSPISDKNISLDTLAEIFDRTNRQLLYSTAVLTLFIAIASIFVSHKVAGPVYRFEQSVKAIAEGDLTLRIKLRKGDEMMELADMFNHMTTTLETLVVSEQAKTRHLGEIVSRLKKGETIDKATLEELSGTLDELQAITAQFKVREAAGSVVSSDNGTGEVS